MKKIILSLSVAVFALCLASSCDDDENVVLSSDCYINSLTLGNVKRVISTVGSSGNDTTYIRWLRRDLQGAGRENYLPL